MKKAFNTLVAEGPVGPWPGNVWDPKGSYNWVAVRELKLNYQKYETRYISKYYGNLS